MSTTASPLDHVSDRHARHHGVRIVPLGLSLSSFLALTFALCTLAERIPMLNKFHFLSALYPGIDWTASTPLLLGVIAMVVLGWYTALVFGALYNFFGSRR